MAINNTEIDSNLVVEECFAIANAIDNATKDAHEPKAIYDAKRAYVKHLRGKIWLEYKNGTRKIEGIDKPTDKAVESAVDADPEYFKAVEEMNSAYKDFLIVDDYASALDAKKAALKIIANFSLAGWNSALRIASQDSIEKFVMGDDGRERSIVEEREALRERKRRRAKEEEDGEEIE